MFMGKPDEFGIELSDLLNRYNLRDSDVLVAMKSEVFNSFREAMLMMPGVQFTLTTTDASKPDGSVHVHGIKFVEAL